MDKQLMINYSDKITKWTLVSLAFLHPLILNPWGYDKYNLTKLVLLHLTTLILVVAWAVRAKEKSKLYLVDTPLGLPLLSLGFVVIASTIFSIYRLTSIYGEFNRYEGSLTILNYFLICYLALLYFSSKAEKDYRSLIQALFLSASLVSTYGIAQHFGFDFFQWVPQNIDPARSFSTLANPIFLGVFLSLVIPLLLIQLLRCKSLAENLLLSGVLALVGSCLIFTYSRAAWLGSALSVIIVAVYAHRTIWQKKQVLLQITLATAVIIVVSNLPAQTSTVKTYSVLERASSTFEVKEATVSSRLAIWQTTPAIIKTRSLVGFGPDTLRLVFPKYKSVKVARQLTEPGMVDKAHNNLLQVAATLGLLGLLFYLWFLTTFFWKGFVNLRKNSNHPLRWLQVGMLASTLSYVVQIQFSFSIISVAPIFWLIVGLVNSTWGDKTYTLKLPTNKNTSMIIKYSLYLLLAILTMFTLFNNAKTLMADTHANYGWKSLMDTNYGEAAAQFEQATKLNPNQDRYYLFLGTTYFKIATHSKAGSPIQIYWLNQAEKSLKHASRLNPFDEIPYLTSGGIYFNLGSENPHLLKKASFYFKKALRLDPNNYKTHFNLGTVYASQEMLEKAISEWEKTIQLSPSFSDAYYNLGKAFEEKGNLKKAESYYRKAVQLKPTDAEARASLNRIRKAKERK